MSRYEANGGVSGSASGATGGGTRKLLCNDTKSRSRMSLTVGPELRRLIEEAKNKSGNLTASKAVRWALKRALKPPPSVTLGLKIIKWGNALEFISPRERQELRTLVHEMYEQLH